MDKLTDERYKRAQNTTDPEELEKIIEVSSFQ